MKRDGDKRMYLIERDPKRRTSFVTPVWGRRAESGVVTYTRFRRDDRMWAEPTSVFDTELQAWQYIEKLATEALADARSQIRRVTRFMLTVRRQLKRLTPNSQRCRR